MQIIGHRGAAGLAPENTIASFKAAIEAGVDWIEFDVRATKDGQVIVSHDANTLRASRRPHSIAKTDYATLKKLPLKGGQHIPTLAEAFHTIGNHTKINVEIKVDGCAGAVVDQITQAVKKGASYTDFMVSSFKASYLRDVHRLDNNIPLALLHGANPYKFLRLKGLRVQAVGFSHKRLPNKAIYQAELRELMIYVYTVNSLKKAKDLIERNVQAVVTNRPDKLQEIRGEATPAAAE